MASRSDGFWTQSPPVLALTTTLSPLRSHCWSKMIIRLIGRSVREVGAVGEAVEDEAEVVGGLLAASGVGLGVLGVGEEPGLTGLVTPEEISGSAA